MWGSLSRDSPRQVVHNSVAKLEVLARSLRELRTLAVRHVAAFSSSAFTALFQMIAAELDDEYLDTVESHLAQLRFPKGMVLSAQLGAGNKGTGYVLREPHSQGLLERLGFGGRFRYSFTIPERDTAGFRALDEIENKGLNTVAAALGQATEHVVGFFATLRAEIGFYVGCLNLHQRLAEKGEPTCFPEPRGLGADALAAEGLYDPALTLHLDRTAVGNGVRANGKSLVMITGANQGGKSTFLRSVGVAQLMMQAGMFVCAESLAADVRTGVFSHYRREEDTTMTRGKLEEELSRMSEIADEIRAGGMLLSNESFSSTNEREGSEIARQVFGAMLESGVKVMLVTHLFELAHGFHAEGRDDALFLRAERRTDGTRTFRLVEAEPLPTGHGADSYRRILGADQRSESELAEGGGRSGSAADCAGGGQPAVR